MAIFEDYIIVMIWIDLKNWFSYVFLACSRDEDRKNRLSELVARCFVIGGIYPENRAVVGIAAETYEKGKAFSMDAIIISMKIIRRKIKKILTI